MGTGMTQELHKAVDNVQKDAGDAVRQRHPSVNSSVV